MFTTAGLLPFFKIQSKPAITLLEAPEPSHPKIRTGTSFTFLATP